MLKVLIAALAVAITITLPLVFLMEPPIGGIFLWLDIALGIQLWVLIRRYRRRS